jgi:hypothetical protein|tara:strand:+ start:19121 stop:19501 length:381 start_codon:yes stop_codon:yes gene_type:complete
VVDTFLLGLRGMNMIKLKKNPPSKENKRKELRKGHREFLKKQGVSLDKEYQDMTYEEKGKYHSKIGNKALDMLDDASWVVGVGGVAKVGRVALSIAKNPKKVGTIGRQIVRKVKNLKRKMTKGATK